MPLICAPTAGHCTKSWPTVNMMIKHQMEKSSSTQENGKKERTKPGSVNSRKYFKMERNIRGGSL